MNNRKWYFTFGTSSTQPFCGGWVEVIADTLSKAIAKFNEIYPPRKESGLVNCSMIYSKEQFEQTEMYQKGSNLDAGCHRVIT